MVVKTPVTYGVQVEVWTPPVGVPAVFQSFQPSVQVEAEKTVVLYKQTGVAVGVVVLQEEVVTLLPHWPLPQAPEEAAVV